MGKVFQDSAELQQLSLEDAPERLTLKRAIDVTGAVVLLMFFAPLMITAAIAIKLDSKGPVFFRQKRTGRNKIPFRIWKFRTMTVLEDDSTIIQATKDDQRVTRVGRILRSTSIDELPQLFNVLTGDMSLVGPRPHACAHDLAFADVFPQYDMRFAVRPGITGLAQVIGLRGETDTPAKIRARARADIVYIRNHSLFLDILILFRTVFVVLLGKNAY